MIKRVMPLSVNQFAQLMSESRSGNSANASARKMTTRRQAKALISHYAFMADRRNSGLAYGWSRNG